MIRALRTFAAAVSVTTAAAAQPPAAPETPAGPSSPPADVAPEAPPPAPPAPSEVAPPPAPRAPLPPTPIGARMELRPRARPPAPARGAYVHDGFYLRAATGFGVYEESLVGIEASASAGDIEGRTVGLASLGELALGGTVAKGLVLGGGAYTAQLVAAHFKVDRESDGAPPSQLDPELRTLGIFGPFVDWYPRPRKGFHVVAALGFAALTSSSGSSRGFEEPDYQAVGGGLVLGAGYEWFIAEEWSIGVLSRTMAVVVTGEDDDDVRWVHGVSTTPSLLVSVTHH